MAEQVLRELIITKLCNQPPLNHCNNSEHYSHQTTSSVCKECLADSILLLIRGKMGKMELTDDAVKEALKRYFKPEQLEFPEPYYEIVSGIIAVVRKAQLEAVLEILK